MEKLLNSKPLKIKPMEKSIKKQDKNIEAKGPEVDGEKTPLGIYPRDMREAFERQTSYDALRTETVPGVVQRFINCEARKKTGRDQLFVLQENAEEKRVGDLMPAFAPRDLVEKIRADNHERGLGRIKKEQEQRKYEMEKLYRDTEGRCSFHSKFSNDSYVTGNDKPEFNKGTKTYFYGK